MKLSAHLGKISWSLGDKVLYVLYGLVQLQQIKALPTDVYGVFSLLVALNTWIMIVSDGSALAGLIQFGTDPAERSRLNLMGLTIHTMISGIGALAVFVFQDPLAHLFHEPRFVMVATMLPVYCLLTLPRMFCLKIIYRDMRMRDLFVIDLVWFGVRTGMTIWAIQHDELKTLTDIIKIDFVGMAASSLAALWYTRKDLTFGRTGTVSLRTYLSYGVPLALATALNSTPRQLDVLVIAAFYNASFVGVYNSAKNLFRFFEQAFDAVVTLVYPAAVRMFAEQRMDDLQVLITKAISVTLIPTVLILIILEAGGSNIIVWFLGQKYVDAVGHFNVLILAALGMPFTLMSSIIAAMGHSTVVVRYSAYSLVVGMAVLFAVCLADWPWAVGLGLVTNTIVVGFLCTAYVRSSIHFPLKAILRAMDDVRSAIAGMRSKA